MPLTNTVDSMQEASSLLESTSSISVVVSELSKIYVHEKPRRTDNFKLIAANDEISLEIKRGEIFGLLGPNGAGKTTLVNQILGLTRPTSGSILVEGVDVVRHPHSVKTISSYLPQKGMAFDSIEVLTAL